MPTTYSDHRSNTSAVLLVAFELGWTKWRLAFGMGIGKKTWQKTVPARDLDALTGRSSEPRRDSADTYMQEIDSAVDNGDLSSGFFRKLADERYYFVLLD